DHRAVRHLGVGIIAAAEVEAGAIVVAVEIVIAAEVEAGVVIDRRHRDAEAVADPEIAGERIVPLRIDRPGALRS
ncbi:MAG: hypothetical protein ACXVO1_09560, partial [Tumebacillaceae bacterium]